MRWPPWPVKLFHGWVTCKATTVPREVLLAAGVSPNLLNREGESPLLLAVRLLTDGRVGVLRQLMKAKADGNLGDVQENLGAQGA